MAECPDSGPSLSQAQLIEDLADVSDWYGLGLALGLKSSQLDIIEQEIPRGAGAVLRGKSRVADTWIKERADTPSWSDVVTALYKMKEDKIADRMKEKYSGGNVAPTGGGTEHIVVNVPARASTRASVKDLKLNWAKLIRIVCIKLSKAKKVSIEDVFCFICVQISIELPESCSSSFFKIFRTLQNNKLLDFWNCSLLWNIVNVYLPRDKELQRLVKEYQFELMQFKKNTKVINFIPIIESELSPDVSDFELPTMVVPTISREDHYKPYTFEMDADPHDAALMDVEKSWDAQITQYSLPDLRKGLLQLIVPSSILVSYLVPAKMVSKIVRMVRACVGSFFNELEILNITVGEERVFFKVKSSSGSSPRTSRLLWRRGTDAPDGFCGMQAVVMGERVYVGGDFDVYQYDWRKDTWSTLPDCPVFHFGMAQFLGKLITIGGADMQWPATGKVYQFNEQAQQWEEFLPPMPTARSYLTVVTSSCSSPNPPAIASCGGRDAFLQIVDTVEVYSHASSQWHTVNALPIPCFWMTAVTIDNTCYILGGCDSNLIGSKYCFSASLDAIIDSTSSPSSQLDAPNWTSEFSDIPLIHSTSATMRGSLITIGGLDTSTDTTSASICVLANNGSWERVMEDLPEPCYGSSAVCLPSGELLVAGGCEGTKRKRTVFIATFVD